MKIEHVEAIALDMQLQEVFKGGTYQVATRPTIITRVHLENGLVGETYGGDEFHTQAQIVQVIRDHLGPLLQGQDVRDFQRLWEAMFNIDLDLGNRGLHQLDMHPRGILLQAISCLDNAMWDARGKLYDVPVYKLLGGVRDRVPVISIGGYYPKDGSDPAVAIAKEVESVRQAGCIGIKMKVGRATLEEDFERVRAARKAGGKDFVITVDANQGWHPLDAVKFCVAMEKADLGVRWMEEPVKWYDQTDGLMLLATKTSIPINVGQGEITGRACRDLITKGGVSILNLDVTLCGGITEWQRVADMARFMNVEMAHHEEPQVAIHLMAANPHALFVEIFANRQRDPLLWELPEGFPDIRDGYMAVPQAPGLGIRLRPEVIERYRVDV
ncbi:L-talarate dehydratase @ Galactarate dehydratase [plant metagenome]|uniref:L-talarate dehydratase @ Galactarate dehydratase n=3 Tax=root TaxID=1 RepID=A0A1C3K1S5_9BURK|nr:mandelate racemase/muconate lactonizing enzyme family protein [Orrella dioscoreae]SBT25355.1 L-talarate dehydratase @ Galactarate dehydratase [Orrella dioscoreae]SOE49165.1 L-talarate dehydratase @ Galactarate dehydratase [Orrella dioscoreae]